MAAPFGPFYPPSLQSLVTHAERLVESLRHLDGEIAGAEWVDPNEPTEAELWLHGRPEEIETFVSDVIQEWRRGAISVDLAVGVLASYITDVHRGFASAFGRMSPGCCAAEEKRTIAQSEIKTVVPSRARSAWSRLLTFSFGRPPTPTPSTPRVV